ncbi:MAG: hypothetical protein Q7S12_00260 [bacterium]|nr:hypothetical protein [bacterium]
MRVPVPILVDDVPESVIVGVISFLGGWYMFGLSFGIPAGIVAFYIALFGSMGVIFCSIAMLVTIFLNLDYLIPGTLAGFALGILYCLSTACMFFHAKRKQKSEDRRYYGEDDEDGW